MKRSLLLILGAAGALFVAGSAAVALADTHPSAKHWKLTPDGERLCAEQGGCVLWSRDHLRMVVMTEANRIARELADHKAQPGQNCQWKDRT